MPQLQIFDQPNFPSHLNWQAVSFMRVQWPSIFSGSLRWLSETYPASLNPVHFALCEGEVLISYAAALRLALPHQGYTYDIYGFGNVFTFPPYRHEGCAQHVLQAAAHFLDASDVDVAILFCHPSLVTFYAQSGWEACSTGETRIGTPETYTLDHDVRMMRFISPQAKDSREDFLTEPIYIKWPW